MDILQSEFVSSVADVLKCPPEDKPEFAFIGRSNVGKSSLINMLTNRRNLAKISVKPGKTQTINHFIINNKWYLVDLPGYGYASVSKTKRFSFGKMIEEYLINRKNLSCVFILIDCRLEPQPIDLSFIEWAGTKEIPICLIFTKADKLNQNQLHQSKTRFENTLLQTWDELPPIILTSSTKKKGKDDVLGFIEQALANEK
ncbi:MAG TPA: ribosome biogenesis GTP-binding protein YihA/YsxC [Cyclobacteriaceae bacterium]|jgi:GTP-binding protein|nr:ribosome biogenesis GTP-binding protein YihA/YsxC [Cyclobacteriaceae bacterium]